MTRARWKPTLSAWFAVALSAAALTGCFGDGLQSTIRPESDNTRIIHDVYALVTWIDIGIFVVVFALIAIAMVRFRAKDGDEIPRQVHGSTVLELLWTIVPAVLLIFIAVPTWSGIFRAANAPAENAFEVEAIGHQWWWEFKYPDGSVTANELHVPVNRPVVVHTKSIDVIHSLWAPRLFGKIDVLPGKVNTLWFVPEKTGRYYGQCAEFCGTAHANMRFRIVVDNEADLAAFMASLSRPPQPETDAARAGQQLFLTKACVACHTIQGVPGAVGTIGPSLNNLAARSTIASGIRDNTPENLAAWIHDPQAMKEGALMVLPIPVSEAEAAQLAAYLLSPPAEAPAGAGAAPAMPAAPALPAMPAEQAAPPAAAMTAPAGAGDAAKGQQVYMSTCFVCHGPDPSKDGAIGPAIHGSSRALIEARVMHGNAQYDQSYPPGYTPKRATRLMTPFPHLKGSIDDLTAFLNK